MNRYCQVADCQGAYKGRGFCGKHYDRWRRHGDPAIVKRVRRAEMKTVDGVLHKKCTMCMRYLPVATSFGRSGVNGWRAACKPCWAPVRREKDRDRARNGAARAKAHMRMIRAYGVSPEWYEAMSATQQNRCAICRGTEPPAPTLAGRSRRLSVDHDHSSGLVRGLLCGNCNRALGLLRDDPAIVARAVAYLENPPSLAVTEPQHRLAESPTG